MPCDNYSNVAVNVEYVNATDDIEYLMHENECNAFVITGDFNTCYVQINAQTKPLLEFEDRNDLLNAWQNSNAVRDYTYVSHSLNYRSCIDHFLVSQNVFDLIMKRTVNYNRIHPSSHSLAELKLHCNTSCIKVQKVMPTTAEKCLWYKAKMDDITMYQDILDERLGDIIISKDDDD